MGSKAYFISYSWSIGGDIFCTWSSSLGGFAQQIIQYGGPQDSMFRVKCPLFNSLRSKAGNFIITTLYFVVYFILLRVKSISMTESRRKF